ncbi:transposase [Streptomyces sp. NBC_01210]|nr:transposase [Streptomyces sp. NBC_01210]
MHIFSVAQHGYCASHSRFFWGLRLHLVCTFSGLPIAFALVGAEASEQQTLPEIFAVDTGLPAQRPGQTLIGDKNYFGAQFEAQLADLGVRHLRPARRGEAERPGAELFKPLRQVVEPVNQTLEGQLDLKRHGGRTVIGVSVSVLQRLLALTAAIWHNAEAGAPVLALTDRVRPLTAERQPRLDDGLAGLTAARVGRRT